MSIETKDRKIAWYRTPVDREVLGDLLQRSDGKGLLQMLGHLGLLAMTSAAAWYAAVQHWWLLLGLALFLHGTFYAFLLNGFHELCHKTVFKSKNLNVFFLYLVSFLSWNHPVMFWASHQEHHKFTLHPPDDLEVVLPVKITLADFWKNALINPWDLVGRLKSYSRMAMGRLQGDWQIWLFPETAVRQRQRLFTWARLHLAGHILLVVVSLAMGAWLVPVLITLAPFYGGWLLFLCNNTQHIGLQNNVPDFRLCTRTILLNPFVRFLYWHMNYHIEHHMFAAVPCYHLARLHAVIEHDLPPSPVGLVATWKEVIAILKRQAVEPGYQYVAPLPGQ
jgi:fatty acid desaturase